MRRTLGALVLGLLLVGCADREGASSHRAASLHGRGTTPIPTTVESAIPDPDKPYGDPSIGTVPGESESQAGQIRAAKFIQADPFFGGVVLGRTVMTVYLTKGYDHSGVDKARSLLGPHDRLRVEVVDHLARAQPNQPSIQQPVQPAQERRRAARHLRPRCRAQRGLRRDTRCGESQEGTRR